MRRTVAERSGHLDRIYKKMEAIIDGSRARQERSASFHAAIMLYAEELQHEDAYEVCKRLGFTPTHYTEVRKSIKAWRILDRMGYRLVKS